MKLFKTLKGRLKAFLSIKADDENRDVFTVTCDESIKLDALPDLLPPVETVWKAANDLDKFRVLDTYPDSREVLVEEMETGLTFLMNVDVFDLLFSVRVPDEETK
jgi:hypothetical protein